MNKELTLFLPKVLSYIRSGVNSKSFGPILAVALCLLTFLVRLKFAPLDTGMPLLTFIPAITLAAIYGGVASAVLALLLTFIVTYLLTYQISLFSSQVTAYSVWFYGFFSLLTAWIILAVAALYRQRQHFYDKSAKLSESQAHFQLLINNINGIATFMLDAQGKVTAWSQGANALLGYSEDEIVGHTHSWFYPPNLVQADLSAHVLALALAEGLYQETGWRVHKSGKKYYANIMVTPYFNAQDHLSGFIEVHQEVLDHRPFDQHLQNIIQLLPVPMLAINAQNVIQMTNTKIEELLGYPSSELLGVSVEFIFQDAFVHLLNHYRKHNNLVDNTSDKSFYATHKKGQMLLMEVELTALNTTDNPSILAVFTLKTEHAAEATEKDKIYTLEDVKTAFLTNMPETHFNTASPVSIPVNTDIVLDQTAVSDKNDSILKSVLNILDDIFDYSKIDADKLELAQKAFLIEDVLKSVHDLFLWQIIDKKLELFLEIDSKIQFYLHGDQLRLEQILHNLVDNAVKFTYQGEIHIKAELLDIQGQTARLQFMVADTGVGIDTEYATHLFMPDYDKQVASNSRPYKAGFGLMLCQRLVELMGGEIAVSSTKDQGSRFIFTACFAIGRNSEKFVHANQLQPMRALLVDEKQTGLDIISHYLQNYQLDVTRTIDVLQAQKLINQANQQQKPFEVLLVNWNTLKNKGGISTMRDLKAALEAGYHSAASIMMLDDEWSLLEQMGAELPGIRLLLKPILPCVLLQTLFSIQQPDAIDQAVITDQPVNLMNLAVPIPGAQSLLDWQVIVEALLAPVRSAHILLVEDHINDTKLSQAFFTRSGLLVKAVNHGPEVVTAMKQQVFDLVLMDLHGQAANNFSTCQLIRSVSEGRNLPIIGIAHADRLNALSDSMNVAINDYLTLPIEPEKLILKLLNWIKPTELSQVIKQGNQYNKTIKVEVIDQPVKAALFEQTSISTAPQAMARQASKIEEPVDATSSSLLTALPSFELSDILAFYGNESQLKRILVSFAKNYANAEQQIEAFIAADQMNRASELLHRLQGAATNLGAKALAEAATQLKNQIRSEQALSAKQRFSQQLEIAVLEIQQLEQTNVTPKIAAKSADPDEILQAIDKLMFSLSKNEVPSDTVMQGFTRLLTDHVSEALLIKLNQDLDNFQFEKAKLSLAKIKDECQLSFC